MNCFLMDKDIPVVQMELDGATCTVSKVGVPNAPEHMPVGITVKKGRIDRAALNEWWEHRAIPAVRPGIRAALEQLGPTTPQKLMLESLGLSLSDQYWICPQGAQHTWSAVNFFQNEFTGDVRNALMGMATTEKASLMSPDSTTGGWLKKRWQTIGGTRYLLKGGSGPAQQEPYNEALASAVMRRLSIPHVPYTLRVVDDQPYSFCEDFITPRTELIPAWYIMQTQKKANDISVYQHYLNCCEALGIPGMADAMDRMMAVDFIIANEDRHQNNFGAVRDAETLEWVGAAPVYDSGTSLWFDRPIAMISATAPLMCKPFKSSHDGQIKLVRSFDWLDLTALNGIEDEFREIVSGSPYIDEARCDALCHALRGRIDRLAEIVQNHSHTAAAVDLSGDVQTNRAYNGPTVLYMPRWKTHLTAEEATAKARSRWYEGLSPREIVDFQLYEESLCMPLDLFEKALDDALGRLVHTHEFRPRGWAWLQQEFESRCVQQDEDESEQDERF